MTEEIWTFETDNFTVSLEVEPEEMDPADSFQFQEDIDAVRNGAVNWFAARVVIRDFRGQEIGSDSLGGCAYKTFEEFYQSHRDPNPLERNSSVMRAARGSNVSICHYFPSMVSEAIKDARRNLASIRALAIHA